MEVLQQSLNEERHFGTLSASVQVCFVDHEQQFVRFVSIQPLPGCFKEGLLDRSKKHVFEHGIVRHKDVWSTTVLVRGMHFLPSEKLTISWLRPVT